MKAAQTESPSVRTEGQGHAGEHDDHRHPTSGPRQFSAYEESWVSSERAFIYELRRAHLELMALLGLRGHRHDDYPAIWSAERVARLERRRRKRVSA